MNLWPDSHKMLFNNFMLTPSPALGDPFLCHSQSQFQFERIYERCRPSKNPLTF